MVELIENGTISVQDRQGAVRAHVGRRGASLARSSRSAAWQINDTGAIEKAIDELIAANPDKAEAVKEKPSRPSAGSSAR
jgi:aspartyl-tRNA(Asn)/glutamyl-tRNA(Gln) amidotransferase subunit B